MSQNGAARINHVDLEIQFCEGEPPLFERRSEEIQGAPKRLKVVAAASAASEGVPVTSKPSPPTPPVKCIRSRTGWYVDYIEIEYWDDICECHGNSSGGLPGNGGTLLHGETIVKVVQQGWSHGHLGTALLFKLSSGREIKICGTSGQRKIKEHKEVPALLGPHTTRLVFENGILEKVFAGP